MLYKFELGFNVAEATKNIHCAKSEDAVQQADGSRNFTWITRSLIITQGQLGLNGFQGIASK